MRVVGDRLIFSPSDLFTYAESEFASWMDRCEKEAKGRFQRDSLDEMNRLVQSKGEKHESTVLAEFRKQGLQVVDLSSKPADDTIKAMKAGADLIYQASLSHERFEGVADFLIRVPGPSRLGDYHYQVWDSKLSRKAKAYFLIQLCAYSEMLEKIQNFRPDSFGVILGNGKKESFRTNDYYFYYEVLKDRFLAYQDNFSLDAMPDPAHSRVHGRWSEAAQSILLAKDSVTQVARITSLQSKRLAAVGIQTMSHLAACELATVKGIAPEVLRRLVKQAKFQLSSKGKDVPDFELLDEGKLTLAACPPSDAGDIFFDMEGFPFASEGLEYLWGYVYLDGNSPRFDCLWAHDACAEREALIKFVNYVHARWLKFPGMHVYHYASYETTAIRNLAQRYGCCEDKIDDLLRNEVFVDLYQVVRQAFVIGEDSYSIKAVEHIYRPRRKTEVANAATSVVYYQNWIDATTVDAKVADKILEDIRKYNEDDCQSTYELNLWLRSQMEKHKIVPLPRPEPVAPRPLDSDMQQLLATLEKEGPTGVLLGQLIGYHQREDRQEWWTYFARFCMTSEDLFDEQDCLAGLQHDGEAPVKVQRSLEYTYTFDANQLTKVQVDEAYCLRHDGKVTVTITSLDLSRGVAKLKTTAKDLPPSIDLLPKGPRRFEYDHVIKEYAEQFLKGARHQALDDFLNRRAPRLQAGLNLPKTEADTTVASVVRLIAGMSDSALVVQGPPGAGKTYIGARAIAELCKAGKRVGIMSNSHKAIDNLLVEAWRCLGGESAPYRIVKVGREIGEAGIELVKGASSLQDIDSLALAGGTAWLFAHESMQEQFDYLFIDEASQVCLAKLVAVSRSARNLVFLGDQMQLAQPAKGSHPGDSGLSCLDYYLKGQATIKLDQGIFLPVTRRLNPDICGFISDAVYEGRLTNHPSTSARKLVNTGKETYVRSSSGISYVPVKHEGNRQSSDEEVAVVKKMVDELLKMSYHEGEKIQRPLTCNDILIVAPYNLQARLLEEALGEGFRIASVDKFQGQEAPVVILSLGASSAQDAPRGIEFIFDKNRLNVALSRAMALALVVGSPTLAQSYVSNPAQMALVNFFCRIVGRAQGGSGMAIKAS